MNVKEYTNIIGLVFTIIGGLITIFLIPYANIRQFITNEANWLLPVLMLFFSICLILIGFFSSNLTLKYFRKQEFLKYNQTEFGDVTEREKIAKVIWIVTKRLHYDINHPDYIQTIKENLKRGTKYRYIVPDNEEIASNIASFKTLYLLDDEAIDRMFLKITSSDIVKFLRPITIYDPYENNTLSYFYGHTRDKMNNDYLVFDNRKSIEYVNLFKSVWYKHKSRMPIED